MLLVRPAPPRRRLTTSRAPAPAAPTTRCACSLTARLVREAEEKLVEWTHPDPWVNPYMPGGSRFMRNPAVPLSIVFPPDLFPEGVPPEYNIASQVRARACARAGRAGNGVGRG